MTGDNPFAEPGESDHTVVRPVSSDRRATVPAEVASATLVVTNVPGAEPSGPAALSSTGASPLTEAAAPLLQLLARLRNTFSQPDPTALRDRAIRALRDFGSHAREAGISDSDLRHAHYALCASLDDVVLSTPWGSQSVWARQSLISSFHQEVQSGERFFDLLAQLRQDPGRNLAVLELMYLCLSLGFMGRYRLSPRGPGELERLREDLYTTILRQRPAAEAGLSPRWQGIAAPYRPARPVLPIWVAGAAALAIVAAVFLWCASGVSDAADRAFAAMAAAPPSHMPEITRAVPVVAPPPAPMAGPTLVERLRTFLKPEIDRHLVTVFGDASTATVRISNAGMFGPGSATIARGFLPLLDRIAGAVKQEHGQMQVIGYTDNQPIRTVRFPSNFALSAARANAARDVLARGLGADARITAEGRGQAEPIASNATPSGRAANRRIEIVVTRANEAMP